MALLWLPMALVGAPPQPANNAASGVARSILFLALLTEVRRQFSELRFI
jgi:hypothetical protein